MTEVTGTPLPCNDRLFLHLVRSAGALSKAELTCAWACRHNRPR